MSYQENFPDADRYSVSHARRIVTSSVQRAFERIRYLFSVTEGCGGLLARVKGEAGDVLQAELAEALLVRLGDVTDDANPQNRRRRLNLKDPERRRMSARGKAEDVTDDVQ